MKRGGRSLSRSMRRCANGGPIPSRRAWHKSIVELADHDPADVTLTRLAARAGSRPAMERARAIAADSHAPEQERLAMLDLLGELKDRASVGLLLNLTTQ